MQNKHHKLNNLNKQSTLTTETQKLIERAAETAISQAEQIDIPGVTISAWCDFGGADESSAPIVCCVTLEDSDEFEQLPPKRERIESVVKALWAAGIHAVDSENQLGRYIELFHSGDALEDTAQIKVCGFVSIY